MLWILITVLVGLFVIIVQLLLSYQRRAARLKIAQNPVRKQISDYKDKIVELGESIRATADESLVKLKEDLTDFERRSGQAATFNAELDPEAQAWVAEREGDDGHDEEEEDPLFAPGDTADEPLRSRQDHEEQDEDADGILGGRKDSHLRVEDNRANPVELVRAIRHELEETFQYIESLRTDASLVQQSLQWLGQDKEKAVGKDGANGSA